MFRECFNRFSFLIRQLVMQVCLDIHWFTLKNWILLKNMKIYRPENHFRNYILLVLVFYALNIWSSKHQFLDKKNIGFVNCNLLLLCVQLPRRQPGDVCGLPYSNPTATRAATVVCRSLLSFSARFFNFRAFKVELIAQQPKSLYIMKYMYSN